MDLLEIEQVRAHCYASGTHDDSLLTLYADAAEDQAQAFLNRRVYADTDSMAAAVLDGTSGCDPILVNSAIKAAMLLLAGHLYRNREQVTGEALNELPMGAHALLWPYRRGLGV